MSVIRLATCRTCKYGEQANGSPQIECRRFPPTGGPLAIPTRPGVVQVQIHSGFPSVNADFWCGEHKPNLAIAHSAAELQHQLAA